MSRMLESCVSGFEKLTLQHSLNIFKELTDNNYKRVIHFVASDNKMSVKS